MRDYLKKLTPIQLLVIGYALVVLVGALILTLHISSSEGVSQSYIDAVFTTSSAISTTGLVVVDVGSFYSLFGQIVVLVIFQIGGLGYMTFFVFIAYVLGYKMSLAGRIIAKESLSGTTLGNLFNFFKSVVVFTLFFEGIGAIILSIYWMREYSALRAVYLGIFHSVSAFCTAGFSVFPDNLRSFQRSMVINLTTPIISLAGGIGFFVLYDLYNWFRKAVKQEKPRRLSVHSKLALVVTLFVISIGAIVVFVSEKWNPSMSFGERLMCAFFQCISASTTTGYNTINIGTMSFTSLFILILLMFIGASPGSTGGGIKTTTFGTIAKFIWTQTIGKKDVNIFKQRIPIDTINRALGIFIWFVLLVIIDTLILTITEKRLFIQILFEIVSALGNVGLSTGITPNLTVIGKIVLSITMFIGRVGPLTIGFSLIGKAKPEVFRYPEGQVFVG